MVSSRILALLVLACGIQACGSPLNLTPAVPVGGGGFLGSLGNCSIPSTGLCTNYSYISVASLDPGVSLKTTFQKDCTAATGTFSSGSCAQTSAIGFCTSNSTTNGSAVKTLTVFTAPATLASAQTTCSATAGGVFSTTAP